jgi:hypothetical protein
MTARKLLKISLYISLVEILLGIITHISLCILSSSQSMIGNLMIMGGVSFFVLIISLGRKYEQKIRQ